MKKIILASLLAITATVLTLLNILSVEAKLGNTLDENIDVYGTKSTSTTSKFSTGKDVITYFKDNKVITVVYSNYISILEQISYEKAVAASIATGDIRNLILPMEKKEPNFTSSVVFADGHYEESLYNRGIKVKKIYNANNEVVGIISSAMFTDKLTVNKPSE